VKPESAAADHGPDAIAEYIHASLSDTSTPPISGRQTLTATAGRLLIATSPDAIMSNTANTNIKPLNPIGK
jgi:hypothetical protein